MGTYARTKDGIRVLRVPFCRHNFPTAQQMVDKARADLDASEKSDRRLHMVFMNHGHERELKWKATYSPFQEGKVWLYINNNKGSLGAEFRTYREMLDYFERAGARDVS